MTTKQKNDKNDNSFQSDEDSMDWELYSNFKRPSSQQIADGVESFALEHERKLVNCASIHTIALEKIGRGKESALTTLISEALGIQQSYLEHMVVSNKFLLLVT